MENHDVCRTGNLLLNSTHFSMSNHMDSGPIASLPKCSSAKVPSSWSMMPKTKVLEPLGLSPWTQHPEQRQRHHLTAWGTPNYAVGHWGTRNSCENWEMNFQKKSLIHGTLRPSIASAPIFGRWLWLYTGRLAPITNQSFCLQATSMSVKPAFSSNWQCA